MILLIGSPLFCISQSGSPFDSMLKKSLDSLEQQLRLAKDDSTLIVAYERIGFFYERLIVDSSLKYYSAGLRLARQKSYAWGEARLLAGLSGVMEHQGKFAEELELLFQSLKIATESKSDYDIARANRRISGVYFELEDYGKAIDYLLRALRVDEVGLLERKAAIDHYALADAYEKMNQLDSGVFHLNIALRLKDYLKSLIQYVYEIDGNIKRKMGDDAQAFLSYSKGLKEAQKSSDLIGSSLICADISSLYVQLNVRDSAISYALRGYRYGKEVSYKKGIMLNCNLLAELYDSTHAALALQYYKIAAAAKDSLFGVNNLQTIQNLISSEEAKQKQLQEAEAGYREKLRLYGLLSGLAALSIIAFILFRNNLNKQKANSLLQQQKQKVESTLSELKLTQAQLIQSEKMASLGELTAGIAHEIQNPLNFVNNFSEVTNELVDEMTEEIALGHNVEVKTIAGDIKQNLEKVLHHGRRADAIVKGMLQHSRGNSGVREPTDINALADEYLRLAFHGLRAKDKSFNANFDTDFDHTVGLVDIVPQDFGRVLLNLITNAFYAVSEKRSQLGDALLPDGTQYVPTVTVATKKMGTKLEIRVKDNGNGIPDKIIGKIFQPFFTTKPTGQGTGLGLSLSYDFVKAQGGELSFETKEGDGSEFIIKIPLV